MKMNSSKAGLTASATSNLALVLAALGLFQCERTAVFGPKLPDKAHYRVHHLGTYSSKLDEEKEIEGTIFQTTLSFDLERRRRPDGNCAASWIPFRPGDTTSSPCPTSWRRR